MLHAATLAVPVKAGQGLRATKPDARRRAADWLRERHGRNASRVLQSPPFNLELRTAQRVLKGESAWSLLPRMGEVFGADFTLYVQGIAKEGRPERHFWATEKGMQAAAEGLGAFVRARLGSSLPSSDADLIRHAVVNLGWVAIVKAEDGIELQHGEAVESMALRHAREWLATQSPERVLINGAEQADYLAALARLEELVGPREAMLTASWCVERRALDAIKAPKLRKFIKLCTQNRTDPAALPKILSEGGFLADAALLRVQGDGIVSLWSGANLGVNPAQVMGRDLRDRTGDPRYPEMIRAHVLQACRSPEGTYHELRGVEIDGLAHDYNRAAWAGAMDEAGGRFVATVVERLSA